MTDDRRSKHSTPKQLDEPADVIYRIKRGLSGYVSYLAACEMNQSFSEYVLYEPVLRIFTARRYSVRCEVECPGIDHATVGDKKRLDFVTTCGALELALEVKWAKTAKLKIDGDVRKLKAFVNRNPNALAFLCVFGTKSTISRLQLGDHSNALKEEGTSVYADLTRTRYGCRVYKWWN